MMYSSTIAWERIATQMEVVQLTSLYSDGETPYPTNYFYHLTQGMAMAQQFDPVPTLPSRTTLF